MTKISNDPVAQQFLKSIPSKKAIPERFAEYLTRALKVDGDHVTARLLYYHLLRALDLYEKFENDILHQKRFNSSPSPSSYSSSSSSSTKTYQEQLQPRIENDTMGNSPNKNNNTNAPNKVPPRSCQLIFQICTSAMVRYASDPEEALLYAHFFLTKVYPPLRDEHGELCILTGLIHVYADSGDSKYLHDGLDLVKIGLERGMLLSSYDGIDGHALDLREGHERSSKIFAWVSHKILRFHQLKPSRDGASLVCINGSTRKKNNNHDTFV
ncbi:hypothetical protein BDA99DRAFT_494307 [Phascolomyces articulosus]|uniref:Uncharacterized protein n=1 Tax=Phascolomyces articulosus TaxID=60185 RepID=A0AAD5PJK4_9FUNG|nr:hypothetical protein BDA99DRAFT_494307 [Phascolomyces articulosus]